jgi:DeoR/GlpR family transcriptional regulator of sugar metabolism
LSDRQREILQILAGGQELPFRDIQAGLKVQVAERTVRNDLTALRNLGQIESRGKGAGARWRLRQEDRE